MRGQAPFYIALLCSCKNINCHRIHPIGAGLFTSSRLPIHMRTHTGEKRFACIHCTHCDFWYSALEPSPVLPCVRTVIFLLCNLGYSGTSLKPH